MRKFFVLAALMLGLASCQTEPEGLNVNADGTIDVMVNVGVPESITRANGLDSAEGALANGVLGTSEDNTTLRYILQIFDENNNPSKDRMVAYSDEVSVVFPVRLVPNRPYTFVVWTDIVSDKNDTDRLYNTSDLTNVTIKDEFWTAMDESRDAFTATYPVENFTSASDINIKLTRPFAKLRVMTTDIKYLTDLSIVPTTATVTYKEAHRASFNALTGKAGDKTLNKEHTNFTIASYGEANTAADYTLFTDYFFVDTVNGDVAKFEMSVYDQNGDLIKYNNFNTDINVKRNYLTTIRGNILTDGNNINVELKPGFGGETGEIDGKKFITVKNAEELNAAFADDSIDLIIFGDNITLDSSVTRAADPVLTVSKEEEVTIDLNDFKLSSTSTQTGKNYNMFDVRGTLTVMNGTVEYQHTGENMNWNNFAEIFYVGFNGTLNLDGVTAKNLGGSDMAYVIDMVNATNITVNVKDSTLESPYIPIRVFNNNNTGVHNVTINNSTLKGKYCFWVQYWLADGRDEATLKQTLNLDIFNSVEGESNKNNFTFANDYDAPVLYGFNEAVYFDEYGNEISFLTPIAEGVGLDKDGNYVVTADEGMQWLARQVDDGENFLGKTIKLDTDINLYQENENGEAVCFEPIGSYRNETAFKGTFDGQHHTISNLNQNTKALNNGYYYGDLGLGLFGMVEDATVKNLNMDNANISGESAMCGVVAAAAYGDCIFENITVKNSNCADYQYYAGGIVGWASGNHQYINCNVDASTTVAAQWGDFDNSIGGVIGGAGGSAEIFMKDCHVACRIDAYNDVTSSYQWYAYRRCGMLIGVTNKTKEVNGTTYADAPQLTCENVTVTYGDWMNYTYCEFAGKNWPYVRVQAGISNDAYSNPRYGHPTDANGNTVVDDNHVHNAGEDHHIVCAFNQLYGGGQGVYGTPTHDGVTVIYPASYTPEE